jgi:hypothetical protein
MKTLLKKTMAGVTMAVLLLNFNANAQWNLTGNAGTAPGTVAAPGANFLGTTDLQDFAIRTNGIERIRTSSAGVTTIGLGYEGTPGPRFIAQNKYFSQPGSGYWLGINSSFLSNSPVSTSSSIVPAYRVNILEGFPSKGSGYINASLYNPTTSTWKYVYSVSWDGSTIIGDHTVLSYPGNYKLVVQGGILTEKVKIALATDATNWSWPDYVFKKDYKLLPLNELESFINKNNHLPGVPSEAEVKKEGLDVAEMDAKLLKKIEELTLYMIELKKENESFRKALEVQNDKIRSLEESK